MASFCLFLFSNRKVRVDIEENGDVHYSTSILSLHVPAGSVDQRVELKIRAADVSKIPQIPIEFGEMILSHVVQIEPMKLNFKIPAVLSLKHSIIDLPELSSTVIKCYDHNAMEWKNLETGNLKFN